MLSVCYLFDAQSPIILQHEVLVRFIFGKLKFEIVKCSLCWKYLSILQTYYFMTQVKELKSLELEDGDRLHALERRAAHYWEEAMVLLSRIERSEFDSSKLSLLTTHVYVLV